MESHSISIHDARDGPNANYDKTGFVEVSIH